MGLMRTMSYISMMFFKLRNSTIFLCMIYYCALGCQKQGATEAANELPKIIFDTDMGPDYDDVGAIAVLHALADSGECELLATVASDGHALVAPTIEVYNRFFQRAELPIGIPSADAPDFTASNNWNDTIVTAFAPELKQKVYPSAVSIYRKVLAEQPDNSVTIVTVGFLSNISDLLDSPADDYSDLSGMDLVKAKVKQWVAMAGAFPEGSEFNVNQHTIASTNAINNWPRPILFSGVEIGSELFTGTEIARQDDHDNPVARAYAYNFQTYSKDGETARQSWDQTAVLAAVRNPTDYFYVNGPGKFIIHEDGSNTWDPIADASHYFLSHKYPYSHLAKIIDALMGHQPQR